MTTEPSERDMREAEALAKELMRDAAERAEIGDPFSFDIFTADDWLRDWADRIARALAARSAELAALRRQVEEQRAILREVRDALKAHPYPPGWNPSRCFFIEQYVDTADAACRAAGVELEDRT